MSSPVGLENGVVRIVAYHAAWPELYATEEARLKRALADAGVGVALEHTGSTSIPGLAAKPIIDILGGRAAESDRSKIIATIERAGYSYRGEQDIPGRDFFRRGEPRSYHLHLTIIDSAFWDDHRTFRDYLRSHPAIAAAYSTVKHELAARFPKDRPAYIDGKTEFVSSVLATARRESL